MTDFGLGIFNEFWDGVHPHHLPFLHPHDSPNLTISLQRLNAILEKNSESSILEGTRHLLADHNWRTHLVACFVLLRLSPQTRSALFDSFWERLTLGSWVSPQISVVLSLMDRDFKMKGEKVLRDGLTATIRLFQPWAARRHKAGAPFGGQGPSCDSIPDKRCDHRYIRQRCRRITCTRLETKTTEINRNEGGFLRDPARSGIKQLCKQPNASPPQRCSKGVFYSRRVAGPHRKSRSRPC